MMTLSPLDIHNKRFSRVLRGYDVDEVDQFLDQIIKDYELTIRERDELIEKTQDLETKLGHFTNIESTLNNSILVAQETAEEVQSNAKQEAKLIIKEAEKNADRIINEALSKSRSTYIEIEDLKKQAKVFRTRLKTLIEAQLDMVSSDDWDDFNELEVELVESDEEELEYVE